jgi:glycosyltransferase involved in cell wall biosynthesis
MPTLDQQIDLSVVLPTYNRASSLHKTLQSFLGMVQSADLHWELLVVDNNSTDLTRKLVQDFSKTASFRLRYIFEQKQGRSAALNAGIAEAKGKIVAFTDDDVLLDPNWLLHLHQTFERFDCVAVAGRVLPLWNHPKPDWLEMEGQFAVVNFDLGSEFKEIKTPPLGANSAFRREAFHRHGKFRLDLGVRGSKHTITCDDTEFGERLIKAGEKIIYCPTAVIYHPVDPFRTTKQYFLSWYYYNGVSLTRTSGLPTEGVSYLGVPRWHYRELLTHFVKWQLTLGGIRRFHHKLRTYRSIGTILESYRLSHSGGPEKERSSTVVNSSRQSTRTKKSRVAEIADAGH